MRRGPRRRGRGGGKSLALTVRPAAVTPGPAACPASESRLSPGAASDSEAAAQSLRLRLGSWPTARKTEPGPVTVTDSRGDCSGHAIGPGAISGTARARRAMTRDKHEAPGLRPGCQPQAEVPSLAAASLGPGPVDSAGAVPGLGPSAELAV